VTQLSSRTTIAITAALFLAAIATFYVYWTRTPQYTLLHILDAYATADHQATAAYIETGQPRKKRLHIPRPTEGVIHYFAGLQNETLLRAYRVTVQASRIEGTTATLSIKVGETPYQLRFDEQINGRWTLMDFEQRQAFSELALKRTKPNYFMTLVRL
jgi:hypothetical protein